MFWFALLIWAVATVAYELIRPKPKFEDARPAGLGDFQFPTATEGRAVPLIWGRVRTKGPNLIWYGNFRKVARTENVKTGMFSSEDVIIGYRYYVGMQFGICHGPVDKLWAITINDKNVSAGSVTGSGSTSINSPNLFGGEEHGSGGMSGGINWYAGSSSESIDTYLTGKQDPLPAYRGVCTAVWRGGWVGNSNNVAPWAFEIERIPDGLNMASADPGAESPNDYDANPMNVLYEILTNTDWGLSIPGSQIDTTNFQAAASTLFDEGNGFSIILDNATEVSSIIQEIQRQVDGSLFFNRAVGQWQMKLAREDYVLSGLAIFDESNIAELKEYTRQTWEETTNQVRVSFIDRADDFKQTFALAQDPANMDIQGASVQSDVNYPGVKVPALANQLAWRDLKALSYPLAKIKISVNRKAWNLAPGSVFKFSWSILGVSELVFRVASINYGKVGAQNIEIFAIQDIFAAGTGSFGDPTGSGWEEPADTPAYASSANTLIFEAPRQLVVQDPFSSTLNPRAWMGARFPGDGTVSLRSWNRVGTVQPITGSFTQDSSVAGFIGTGTLDNALTDYAASAGQGTTAYDIDLTPEDTLDAIAVDGASTLVADLTTIAWINGEFIGFEKAADIGGGTWRLSRIWRGLFNTAPKQHAASSRIWFIALGGNLSQRSMLSTTDEMDIQLRGVNGAGDSTTEVETPEIDLHLDRIYLAPLAPTDPYLNGNYAPASEDCDTQYPTETSRTGDDSRALEVEVTPRDWREDNITLDRVLGADWADDEPTFDFYIILDPTGTPVSVGPFTIDDHGTTPTAYLLRNTIITTVGANASIPSDARVEVEAKHTVVSVRTNPVRMTLPFTLTSALQSADDLTFGSVDSTGTVGVTFGETGTYTFDIHTALPSSGTLEASINSGTWVTVVAAAASTGTLSVTATDSVALRWQTSGPANPQFFDITGPVSELGYGVLE